MSRNFKSSARLLALCLIVFLSISCTADKSGDKTPEQTAEKVAETPGPQQEGEYKALDPADMDTGVRPGDDFYLYANGNWLKNNPIPGEYTSWGSFEVLYEKSIDALKAILDSAANDPNAAEGSNTKKIGDFYATAMDEARIEADGAKPLDEELKRIADIKDKALFQEYVARLHSYRSNPFFTIMAYQDPGNSDIVIAWLYQAGLGLPSRDYYLNEDQRSTKIREQYLEHAAKMFQLLKDSPQDAEKAAKAVMAIETRLAKASMTPVELRNPTTTYNLKTIKELDEMTPDFDFAGYFKTIGLANPGSVNVGQPKFFQEFNNVVKETGLEELKTYLRWNLVRATAAYLSSDFVNENYRFNREILQGAKKMRPRWKRVLNAANGALSEALGQVYVAKHFPPIAKTRALKMVLSFKDTFAERIKKLEWMSDETKKQALAKLAAFKIKIGYPDKWIDYSSLEVKRDSYLKNIMRAAQFNFRRIMDRVGKAPDRTLWGMSPQMVNAYYHPLLNEIVFPAAILQPPFFDFKADDAINYGAIGAFIGHEITHGFDDRGGQYDKDGNLKNWWSKEDGEKFKERGQQLAKQFDQFVAVDDLHVNGQLTLGENIADLGGLLIAYDSLIKTLSGKEVKKIDGFTPRQRFFLSWARAWRANTRKESLIVLVKTNPHSPAKFRVIGPFPHIDAFYQAFDIKPGDPLFVPEKDRIRIW
ncbi:MAG: M13 family metallopeptidase [bacterium]|nr:M13 family metallopeptidase [bacterium]